MRHVAMSRFTVRLFAILALAMAGLGLSRSALAQQDVVYEKNTKIVFDPEVVTGILTRPDGDIVNSQKRKLLNRLIKVRSAFRSEVLQSVNNL